MRRLILSGTMNTRDLGGHPIISGGFTRYNCFFRSDLPTMLSDEESLLLYNQGITTVIDLRSIREAESQSSFFKNRSGFDYWHCPLNGDGKMPAKEENIPASYLNMLGDSSSILKIMKVFADTGSGCLFHCNAGKDRTGVISALLLSLANVPLPDILADYQVSDTYIRPMVDQLRLANPALPAWVGQSKPEYLSGFLSDFHQKFHSVDDYLLHIGLSALDISNIKIKLFST